MQPMKKSKADAPSRSGWSGRRASIAAVALAAASSALLAAGCGHSPGAKLAQITSTQTTTTGTPWTGASKREALVAFAACMRKHGVPKFPDPKAASDGRIEPGEFGGRAGVDPNSPQFKAAPRECQKLVPGAPSPVGPGPGKRP
jgi:hypothetical protein